MTTAPRTHGADGSFQLQIVALTESVELTVPTSVNCTAHTQSASSSAWQLMSTLSSTHARWRRSSLA